MISDNEKKILSLLIEKCESGSVQAMEELATFYYEDHPELIDEQVCRKMIDYYGKAATAGSQKAQLNLGRIYFDGRYADKDHERARAFLERAISGESARLAANAAAMLGDAYFFGLGVEADFSRAFDYYLEGVLLSDHPLCLCKIGDMYRQGKFVKQDDEKAFFIYTKAKHSSTRFAYYGYSEILLRLAEAKLYGIGTKRDVPGALSDIEKAKRIPDKASNSEDIKKRAAELARQAKEF
jgi:hypothetical protein